MNFHLHTSFNHHPLKDEIIKIIKGGLKNHSSKKINIGASTIILKGEKVICQTN